MAEGFREITVEAVDRAVRDWFDRTVDVRVEGPNAEWKKVPVQFSQGERWSVGRSKQAFRDENGVLILPIIAIRRTGISTDTTKLALGTQTQNITFSTRVDPKTNDIQNLEARKAGTVATSYPPIYDIYTAPWPDRVVSSYQIVVQTQFVSQMNDIIQKIWRSLDIQKSFVAPLDNNGRHSPRSYQFGAGDPYARVPALQAPYVVGFMEGDQQAGDNFEEFTDTERIVKYTTEIKVPFAIHSSPENEESSVKVQRTAYKVVLKDENVTFVDDPAELEAIFGKTR